MAEKPASETYVPIRKVCDLLGISASTARKISPDYIPVFRIPHSQHRRYRLSDIISYRDAMLKGVPDGSGVAVNH